MIASALPVLVAPLPGLLLHLLLRGSRGRGGPAAPPPAAAVGTALAVAAWASAADGADPARVWAGCALGWTLLALAWIDWREFRLPDALTLPSVLAGLAATWLLDSEHLPSHALAAAAAYLGLRVFAAAYRHWRGREGLGRGDAKLLAGAGAWLGPEALPAVLFLAAVFGLALAAALSRGKPPHGALAVPFGACLAPAIWLAWLHGDAVAWLR